MNFDLIGILPVIIVVTTAVVLLLFEAFVREWKVWYGPTVSLIGLAAAFISTIFLFLRDGDSVIRKLVAVDEYSLFFYLLFILTAALVILFSVKYVDVRRMEGRVYYPFILFATTGMMLLPASTDLLTLLLSLGTLSASLYVLIAFNKGEGSCVEAGIKYFVLGSFSLAFLAYGASLVYGGYGTTDLIKISSLIQGGSETGTLTLIGVLLITVGLGFKLSFVPFHMWTPDVYQGAPVPITAFLCTGSKVAVFGILIRFYLVFTPLLETFVPLFWVLSALAMTVGNVTALLQEDIKRLFAYSSIAHIGYILIAFVTFGEMGRASILFYLTLYTIMNLGAFGVITVLSGGRGDLADIEGYRGLGYERPAVAFFMAVSLLSLAGMPPTGGFVARFYIFGAAIESGYIFLVMVGVVNSIIALYYYLRVIARMYTRGEGGYVKEEISPTAGFALTLVVGLNLMLGIFPETLVAFVNEVVEVLI
ncbi:MAG: NADH-quinone oxidoreductase subunit N [Planctomycetota bacterium]|jgi:NADH-quinone oxidoreductase subunit N